MAEFFNKNIKFLRLSKGMSQQELADKVGIDRSTISRIENNEIETTIDNAIQFSQILNVPLPDLVGRDLEKNIPLELPTTDEEYKRILREKGLMDDNDYIDEEKLDKLLKAVDIIENFNNKE